MYLLTSAIVAEHILELMREASEARLARVTRGAARPGIARRLVARVARTVSSAAAAVAAWSDPATDFRHAHPATRIDPSRGADGGRVAQRTA